MTFFAASRSFSNFVMAMEIVDEKMLKNSIIFNFFSISIRRPEILVAREWRVNWFYWVLLDASWWLASAKTVFAEGCIVKKKKWKTNVFSNRYCGDTKVGELRTNITPKIYFTSLFFHLCKQHFFRILIRRWHKHTLRILFISSTLREINRLFWSYF